MVKKILKITLRILLVLSLIPIVYGLIAFAFTYITVNSNQEESTLNKEIYLHSNGVHLDIIINKNEVSSELLSGLHTYDSEQYLAFGWGDKNFYINTPTWGDLKASHALKAMFWNSSTLMHVTRYRSIQDDWVKVSLSDKQLKGIIETIQASFAINKQQNKTILKGKGYTDYDDFYEAVGSYSCLKTCNTWVNSTLKRNGLKACFWTPFPFRLIDLYKETS